MRQGTVTEYLTNVVRRISSLQFRIPPLRWTAGLVARTLSGRPTRIASGPARGLRIAALGTNLGYRLGTTEAPLQAFLSEKLKPGDVFYDLGANVGFFSLIAARAVGPSGAVIAVEPFPEAARMLRRNVADNGFEHVTVVEVAVSDRTGTGTFQQGASTLEGRLAEGGNVEVSLVTVDHATTVLGWPDPTIVKLDVEGAEAAAIAGMRVTLLRARPTLLVEVHWSLDDVMAALAGCDYAVSAIGDVDILAPGAYGHGMLLARAM